MNAVSIILRLLSVCLFFVICCNVSAKETTTKHKETLQNIPSKYNNGTLEVVKHRMKNNLHLFSSHFTSAKHTHSYYITTNERGKFQWALKFRTSNNSLIFCSQNDIIDTENETIFALSIPKGEKLFVNDSILNTQNETNILLFVNSNGEIIQSIKFTSQSIKPEFGLVVSQANLIDNFVCLVEKKQLLLKDNQPFGEQDGLYLICFFKELISGKYYTKAVKNIGTLLLDNKNQNNSLSGIQLYFSNDNRTYLFSNIKNHFVNIATKIGISTLHQNLFTSVDSPSDLKNNHFNIVLYKFSPNFDLEGLAITPGIIRGISENEGFSTTILHTLTLFSKKDGKYKTVTNSIIKKLSDYKADFDIYDSLPYSLDFLRSQDNYQTNNLITFVRYVYDSQLLKHYKILRRYSNRKLEDVISMEEPLIDSKSVISKDGKYIHSMVAEPKNASKKSPIVYKEYTILIKHEDMFKIEKNKVADK